MNNSHLVPTFEECVKLKDHGFPQGKSYWCYVDTNEPIKPNLAYYGEVILEERGVAMARSWNGTAWPVIAAPTMEEIIATLPQLPEFCLTDVEHATKFYLVDPRAR